MTTKRFGCAGIFPPLFLLCLALIAAKWPSFVDQTGVATTAQITTKTEIIRIPFESWYRQFQITAAYRVPGIPVERHAVCNVEQDVFDSLHTGSPVTVHYLPALANVPLVSGAHLAPCTFAANFGSHPALYHRLAIVFGSLGAILFIAFVLRLRLALWLLIPWIFLFAAYAAAPQLEPAPSQPAHTQAKVRRFATITEILQPGTGSAESPDPFRPIKLNQPFDIIQLEFIPPGHLEPVIAIDSVDSNSIPGLQENQILPIDYDPATPRIVRIQAGTRTFPSSARRQLFLVFATVAGLLILLKLFTRLGRHRMRTLPNQRSLMSAFFKRP